MTQVSKCEFAGFSCQEVDSVLGWNKAVQNFAAFFVKVEKGYIGADSKTEVGVGVTEVGVEFLKVVSAERQPG